MTGTTAAAKSAETLGGQSIAVSSGGAAKSVDGIVSVVVPAGSLSADASLIIQEVVDTTATPAGLLITHYNRSLT